MSQRTSPPNSTSSLSLALLLVFTALPLTAVLALKPARAQSPTPSFSPLKVVPQGTTVKVDGSSSMATINLALKKAYEEKYAGTSVALASAGSSAALKALVESKIDLAAIGRALTTEEKQQGLVAVPIARHKIAIIVGASNPFKGNITFEQFARIFRGEITNWSELGGTPGAIRFVDRPTFSDTRQAFNPYPVFQKAPFKAGEKSQPTTQDNTDDVIQALGTDGIGYAIADQVRDRQDVHVVPMHKTLPDDPRYPFSQPLAYVYKGTPSPAIVSFLGVATAPANQPIIEAARATGATAVDGSPAAVTPVSASNNAVSPGPTTSGTTAPDVATIPPEAGNEAHSAFPWWLLLIPLLGVLLWFWLKGRRTESPDVPPTAAAPPDRLPEPPSTPSIVPPVESERAAIDPPIVVDPPLVEPVAAIDPPIVVEPIATIDPPIVVEPVAAIDPPVIVEPPLVEPVAAIDPPIVVEPPLEPVAAIDPPIVVEPIATINPPIVVAPPVVVEPVAAIDPPIVVEPIVEPVAAIDPPVVIDPPIVVEPVPAIDPPVVVEPPIIESPVVIDSPVVVEPIGAIDPPVVIDSPVVVEPIGAIDPPVVIDSPVVDELPAAIDPPLQAMPLEASPPADIASAAPDGDIADAAVLIVGGAAIGAGLSAALGNQTEATEAGENVGQALSSEALASVDEGLPDLPDGYGESRIVLMPRDPQWGYAYWDVPNEQREALRQQGGQRLALRLYDVTNVDLNHHSAHSLQQYDCDELARDWYVPIPVSDRDYLAEIGYLTGDGRWLLLARSNPVRIPPIYPSDWLDDHFTAVAWDEDRRGTTPLEGVSPAQRPSASASPLYEQIFGMAQSTEALRVAGSLFGSMQHLAGSGQPLPGGAMWTAPVPTMPTPVTMSGIGMSGVGMSGVGISGMSGIGMSGIGLGASLPPLRPRQFWLVADAELIVYGATEPDATVTIDGRPIQLNPDGTFRFQMSFQDGVLNFPILAIAADGEQARSIHMTFERETPHRQTNTKDEAVDEWMGE